MAAKPNLIYCQWLTLHRERAGTECRATRNCWLPFRDRQFHQFTTESCEMKFTVSKTVCGESLTLFSKVCTEVSSLLLVFVLLADRTAARMIGYCNTVACLSTCPVRRQITLKVYNVWTLHWPRMFGGLLADSVDTTLASLYSCTLCLRKKRAKFGTVYLKIIGIDFDDIW